MDDKISEIKKLESEPKIIKNLFNKEEINEFLNLYKSLPITVHNKKQNVIKKRWLQGFNKKLEKIFHDRLQNEIGNFKMKKIGSGLVARSSHCALLSGHGPEVVGFEGGCKGDDFQGFVLQHLLIIYLSLFVFLILYFLVQKLFFFTPLLK